MVHQNSESSAKNQLELLQLSVETISDEQLVALCEAITVVSCKCPSSIIRLIQDVRELCRYTEECMHQFPQEVATHCWLYKQGNQVEHLLVQIFIGLLRRENLLDDENRLCLETLAAKMCTDFVSKDVC